VKCSGSPPGDNATQHPNGKARYQYKPYPKRDRGGGRKAVGGKGR